MTRPRLWIPLLAAAVFGACAPQTPEQQVIEDAVAALGGRSTVEAVTTFQMTGEGTRWNLGQDMTPEATSQTFSSTDFTLSSDLATGRVHVEQTRTPNFNYFRGRDPMEEELGIDDDVAYSVAPDGSASRASDAVARERRARYYRNPITILQAALDPAATVSNARTADGEELVDIRTPDGFELTLAIDAETNLPASVANRETHPNLRDVTVRTSFDDYEDVDGLMLPSHFTTWIDDFKLAEYTVAHRINVDVGDLTAPQEARSQAPITGPPPVNVEVEEVANGVWLLGGQSHHSILVEFSDHSMLIEAPNEARTLAVIAKARELIPDKPVTHLVNTHHHFDHSGGVRAAISEGLTIVTHAANASFFEELAERPSTIEPDALARNSQPLTLVTVDDEMTHEDDTNAVVLYHIAGNPHGDALLMAYLPRQRLLVEADAFSPGRTYQPFAANLLDNIERLGLRVDRIVPVHGGVVSIDELRNVVRAASD